jgi:hypothetical protein
VVGASSSPLRIERSRSNSVTGTPVTVRASGGGSGGVDWSFLDTPADSDATLRTESGETTTFRPDVPGEFSIQAQSAGRTASASIPVAPRTRLLQRHAPRVHFHTETTYKPTRIEALVENASLERDGSGTVVDDPTVFDLADRDDGHYLVLDGDRSEFPNYQEAYPPTVYGTVVPETSFRGDAYTGLVYWFVYVYDPKHSFATFGAHQADVEGIAVLLDDDGPAHLGAFAHDGVTVAPFDQFATESQRPEVYVEHRSHATYLRDSSAYDGDDYQVYEFWTAKEADCGSVNTLQSTVYSEYTGSDEVWSYGRGDYQLVECTGEEIWADYAGGLSDEPGSITAPHQRARFTDPGGVLDGGCPDRAQVSGSLEDVSFRREGTQGVLEATVANSSGKPHEFWVTAETRSGAVRGETPVPIGAHGPSLFGDARTRSADLSFDLPESGEPVRAELWVHPPAVRRTADREGTSDWVSL